MRMWRSGTQPQAPHQVTEIRDGTTVPILWSHTWIIIQQAVKL